MRYFYNERKGAIIAFDEEIRACYELEALHDVTINVVETTAGPGTLNAPDVEADPDPVKPDEEEAEHRDHDDSEPEPPRTFKMEKFDGKGGRPKKERTLQIENMLRDGRPLDDIASSVGVSKAMVYNIRAAMIKAGESIPIADGRKRKVAEPKVPADLSQLPDPDAETDPLSPGDEERLVVDIRAMWIVRKVNSLAVMRELNISMRRFAWLCQKHGLKRE